MRILGKHGSRRGMALLVVLGVMTALIVYAVTVQIAVQSSLDQERITRLALRRRAAAEQALAIASTWKAARTEKLAATGIPGETIEVSLAALNPADPALRGPKSGVAPMAGDMIATIKLPMPPGGLRYIVNVEGKRKGVVLIP